MNRLPATAAPQTYRRPVPGRQHHARDAIPNRTQARQNPGTPAAEAPRTAHCARCGSAIVGCLDPAGRLVPVHAVAVVGGELIVNGSQNQIVHVLSDREAAAAGRRNRLGYTVHERVCRRVRSISPESAESVRT